MSNVCVIGGGAAGMMAAISAASIGDDVTLYEKNKVLGKKLLITGKGRCNVTNKCDVDHLLQNVVTNKKFLYSAFNNYSSEDLINFLQEIVPLKVERGNRVFPQSDKSSDIVNALKSKLNELNVKIVKKEVLELASKNQCIYGIIQSDESFIPFDKVIVATGGISYPLTGSTGDGYRFAKGFLHTVTELTPSLVPIEIKEEFCKDLMGLSLKNVKVSLIENGNELYTDLGEMLFTHFGVSGPLILSASAHINFNNKTKYNILIDLKPGLTISQLDKRILRDFSENINKDIVNVLPKLLPLKLVPFVLAICKIPYYTKVNNITKEQRESIINAVKYFNITPLRFRPISEAIITRGGVDVKEINPKTMESKIVKGLFFAGEVLDVDAYTGGFNLQIAFSTGYLAGIS